MRILLLSLIVALSLGSSRGASASTFGCESVAGSVIFKDTFYGVLTGALLSGLYLLSQSQDDRGNVERTLSGGAALGGLAGFGLGVTEIALRECPPVRLGAKPGFSGALTAIPQATGTLSPGMRLSWNF